MIEHGMLPKWLPLLRKPYEDALSSRTSWQLRVPGGAGLLVERGGQGYNNILFHVRYEGTEYACKLFLADERRRAEREWAALNAVRAAGLDLAPEPVAFASEGPLPLPAIVCSWIEGTALAGRPLHEGQLDTLIAALARIHATPEASGLPFLPAYHQPASCAAYLDEARGFVAQVEAWADGLSRDDLAALPSWGAGLPGLLPLLVEALGKGEAAASQAAASQAAASRAADSRVDRAGQSGGYPPPALIRIDGNLDNVICRPGGRLAFVDWEYSGRGDRAFDLAELRWHPRALATAPRQEWERGLTAYPDPDGDPDFRARLALYSDLLPIWWAARTASHLLEGIQGAPGGRQRLVRLPARLFRGARRQLDVYLAALGLIEAPEEEEREDE